MSAVEKTDVSDADCHAEMLYLQTDKGIYETGEDLWFKAYVLNDSTLTLSNESRTLFVEMLNKQDSIVWQEKYPIQAGIADGHIYIDKKLNPGDYRIHAYTNVLLFERYAQTSISQEDTCSEEHRSIILPIISMKRTKTVFKRSTCCF
ncbi:hypothetical protein [Bacteroides sp.]|uniref:hypothetical protein n=1 Tax=Bacteroides sp. TaxID=29523 RepID=UPI002630E2A7|nr:hypothetical protein [Bacteroides sp.]